MQPPKLFCNPLKIIATNNSKLTHPPEYTSLVYVSQCIKKNCKNCRSDGGRGERGVLLYMIIYWYIHSQFTTKKSLDLTGKKGRAGPSPSARGECLAGMQVAGAGCRDQWSRQGGVRCRGAAGWDPDRRRLLHGRVPRWRRGRPSGEQGPGAPSGEQDRAVSDDAGAGPGGVGRWARHR